MICGTLVTLALNATLLGQPALKVAAVRENATQQTCASMTAPLKSNALLTFKNQKGAAVLTQKIYVADVEFYLTKTQRTLAPLKEAMVFVSVPSNDVTSEISKVELTFNDGSFSQSVNVRLPKSESKNLGGRT